MYLSIPAEKQDALSLSFSQPFDTKRYMIKKVIIYLHDGRCLSASGWFPPDIEYWSN